MCVQWRKENEGADEEFKKLQEKGEVRACPKCGTGISKIDGCDHVVGAAFASDPLIYRAIAVEVLYPCRMKSHRH